MTEDPKDPLGIGDMFDQSPDLSAEEEEFFDELFEDVDGSDYTQTVIMGSSRGGRKEYERRSIQHALMLGADVKKGRVVTLQPRGASKATAPEKSEYGYVIDFGGDENDEDTNE